MRTQDKNKTRVVIVGAGFAGLSAAKRLARVKELEILLLDCNNYHTFQPLLYQVAAAELDSEEIANPLRGLFRRYPRVSLAMLEVTGADFEKRLLHTNGPDIEYDYLILATGSISNFFGIPGAEENTFPLKSLEEAVHLRNHILRCFEQAALLPETAPDGLTHLVVVGGGPAGVEYAGALAELIRTPLSRDFSEMPPGFARVTLVDAVDEILVGFPPRLRAYAHKRLERMGITVRTGAQVKEVRDDAVVLGDGTVLPSKTVVWTAGVRGSDLGPALNLPLGRGGRVAVSPTLQLPEHPEIYIAGDLSLPEGMNLPMVAPNAIQQGLCAAENILRHLRKKEPKPFAYHDKGSLATIGRNAAVARLGRFEFSGVIAWVLWLGVHLTYLVGFHNRIMVLIDWAWDYLFFERSVRLILPRKSALKEILRKEEP